jgi:hypothetical protein
MWMWICVASRSCNRSCEAKGVDRPAKVLLFVGVVAQWHGWFVDLDNLASSSFEIQKMRDSATGVDPIFAFWAFDFRTRVSSTVWLQIRKHR